MRLLAVDSRESLRRVAEVLQQEFPRAEIETVDAACIRTIEDVRRAFGIHFDLALVNMSADLRRPPPEMEVAYNGWRARVQRIRPHSPGRLPPSAVTVLSLVEYLRTAMHASVVGYSSMYTPKELRAFFGDLLNEVACTPSGVVAAVCCAYHLSIPLKHLPPFGGTLEGDSPLSFFTGLPPIASETRMAFENFLAKREAVLTS